VDGGRLLIEHGNEQQEAVADVLANNGWTDIECVQEYGGRPRVSIANR
jgi:release factor glutamine methyltransferase